jgi:hypothetical protein
LVDLAVRPFKPIFEAARGRRYVRTTTKTNEHTDYLGMVQASTGEGEGKEKEKENDKKEREKEIDTCALLSKWLLRLLC